MINNDNSVLTTLSVKYWSGFKYDKQASLKTIEDNAMAKGAGNFNKKLLPKHVLQDIKDIITQFKLYFNENTLPYNALLGTRILPTVSFMGFQKEIVRAQAALDKAVAAFVLDYVDNLARASEMLGKLYNIKDYPPTADVAKRFAISVDFIPVPEAERFSTGISNVQVQRLTKQIEDMSLQAKFDLVNRTERVAQSLLHTLESDGKRLYQSTVTDNITRLSNQLESLNYDNDPLLIQLKQIVDDNILNIRIDYLRDSPTYRKKYIEKTNTVINFVDEINESAPNT